MMPIHTFTRSGRIGFMLLALMALTAAGCSIKDGDNDCPAPERQVLYLVVDGETLRSAGDNDLDDIMLYLFDRNEKLIDTIPYTQSMIERGIPVDLTGRNLEGGFATVWANVSNSVETSHIDMGDDIDELTLRMLPDQNRAGYFLCPGDLFFGNKQIAFSRVSESLLADTLHVVRKNARLNITARGLTETTDPNDYYYRVNTLYSAYDFRGTPQLEPRNIREVGTFNTAAEFVSPEPYIMIHDRLSHVYETQRISVELYRDDLTRADQLIAHGDRSVDGEYIRLEQGKTTNVLLVIDEGTGDVSLYLVVTPWNEIHQWTHW